MPRAPHGLAFRCLAFAVLLLAVGVVVGSAEAARHQHGGPGVYDDRCPLQVLAAVDRAGIVVAAVTATPVEVAATLVALPLIVRPTPAPAADARFRAPPVR